MCKHAAVCITQGLQGGLGMKGEKGIPGFPGPRVSVLYFDCLLDLSFMFLVN